MSMAKLQGHEAWDHYRDGYAKVGVRSFLGSKPTKNNIGGIWLLVFFCQSSFFPEFYISIFDFFNDTFQVALTVSVCYDLMLSF